MHLLQRALALTVFCLIILSGRSAGSEKLKVGDRAPDFTLPAATRDTLIMSGLSLSSLIGKAGIILAFYPADWSGGCTKEMCTMRDNFADLGNLGAAVFGISGDYVFSHREWARVLGLPFTLLSDHDHRVARMYDSYTDESPFNARTVFVIDRRGMIAYIDPAYKAGSQESFDSLKKALASIH